MLCLTQLIYNIFRCSFWRELLMLVDQHNLKVTGENQDAIVAYDDTINAYLALSQKTGPKLKHLLSLDPNMIMAQCLKGYFYVLMGNQELLLKAQLLCKSVMDANKQVTDREKLHLQALWKWCNDDDWGAIRSWEEILLKYPNDILALRLSHHGHFYTGDSDAMCKSIETVMPSWNESCPGFGFVLGMRAFAHEENFNFSFAEEQGRRAVDLNPFDPWAIHSVLHVMEMQDLHEEGLLWIKGVEPYWTGANNFRYHLWWHRALLHLDRSEFKEVLRLYDEEIWDPDSDEYLDFCNDSSILKRLEICGVDVGERWIPLADKIRPRIKEHVRTFSDIHFVIALTAVNDWDSAEELIKTFSIKGGEIRMDIGIHLCQAIVDYHKGDHSAAFLKMIELKDKIFSIGGSNAQRDLFSQILIDTAIKSGNFIEAEELLLSRLDMFPNDTLTKKRINLL